MSELTKIHGPLLDPRKFQDPAVTLKGEPRAAVSFLGLQTLWFNTGTLCNIACDGCYIESSPRNDRLAYLTTEDVRGYLDEISRDGLAVEEIGLTGGEPFMNPHIHDIMTVCLEAGFRLLVLTNAMRPMMRYPDRLRDLQKRYGDRLTLRVSIDSPFAKKHESLRGANSWDPAMTGLAWLAAEGFRVQVAGRTLFGEPLSDLRAAYGTLFQSLGLKTNANDPVELMLFPEMDMSLDVPEISSQCWGILGVDPASIMCATSRMVVKRRGALTPAVVACTLLPYDPAFELGPTLKAAAGTIALNHPHCARFCVLGGASCSR